MVESLVFEGEALVIDAEAVEHSGCEVTDVYRVFGDVVTEVIGFTVHTATGNSASGEPHTEAAAVVVAARVNFSLAVYTASEFATPDDQGIVEHAALFEVWDQCR